MWLSAKPEVQTLPWDCTGRQGLGGTVKAINPSRHSLESYKSPRLSERPSKGQNGVFQVLSPSTLLTGAPAADSCETEGRVHRAGRSGIWGGQLGRRH